MRNNFQFLRGENSSTVVFRRPAAAVHPARAVLALSVPRGRPAGAVPGAAAVPAGRPTSRIIRGKNLIMRLSCAELVNLKVRRGFGPQLNGICRCSIDVSISDLIMCPPDSPASPPPRRRPPALFFAHRFPRLIILLRHKTSGRPSRAFQIETANLPKCFSQLKFL